MKKECEVVQDLLFGYCDETLNKYSKELVEKHLINCIECQKAYEEIKKERAINSNDKIEIDYLKKINNKLKKKKIIITVISLIILLVVIFNVCIFLYTYDNCRTMEVFLKDNITQEQMINIENIIKNESKDAEIAYISKEDELANLKKALNENNDLLAGYEGDNNIFPASYVVKVKQIKDIEKLEKKLETIDGIEYITWFNEKNPYILFLLDVFHKN